MTKDRGDVLELLVADGSDVNARNDRGWTPLYYANHKHMAELILDKGADVNTKDDHGSTPLHWRAVLGQREIAELLIDKGADVNAQSTSNRTSLDLAKDRQLANFSSKRIAIQKEIEELLRRHGGRTGKEIEAGMPYLSYRKNHLLIDGKVGFKYEMHYSANAKEWHVLDTVTIGTAPQFYVDKTAAKQPMRFYQLRLAN